ncbi:MAG: FAD-dependent oxidoreductase [Acidimicrobiales bacterium]
MNVAVVGGGIAGLAAAWELVSADRGHQVTVLDPGPLGGRIQTEAFLGHPVDTGADAFIARVPEGVALAQELGLDAELVAPSAGRALLWVGGKLRPMPGGLVLGAPAHLGPLMASGILGPLGLARAAADLVLPATAWPDDPTVAEVVGRRFGRQVAERLVDPLVGGIHAGRTENLSAESTAPQLARAARGHRSLLLGLRSAPPPGGGPVFLAPRGGMGRLVARLVEELAARGVAFEVQAATAVCGPRPASAGKMGGPVLVEPLGAFDAAVLATPARIAAGLLATSAPGAAAGLNTIDAASVVLVTLAYRREELAVPDGSSGWLVTRTEDRLMTACSFGSAKWPHWSDPETMVLRVSAGRWHDDTALGLADEDLVARLSQEVAIALGKAAAPSAWRVQRWREAFPQYQPGHRAKVARIESALAASLPGVALAGAALRGSGIPACIASGRQAARAVTAPACGT